MARRLTIGLRYKHQEAWTGGVYYVRNLVSGLGLLPADQRPRLVIIGGDADALAELKDVTGYRDLRRLSRARIERRPAPRLPFARPDKGEEISLILIGSSPGLEDRGVQWVPDFQEHRFPEFFEEAELASRREHNARVLPRHPHVMVSSEDVAADLRRFYPQSQARVHIVHFASFLPALAADVDVAGLRAKYRLPERWLLCANQLWKHKNHPLVLRALAAAPDAPTVVFTGREEDHRHPDYPASLRALAAELGIEDRVRFLGFLPRIDQLGLMRGAVAVVQPSLCEGWSTVVEDAKALDRPVLASDIAVHREQLGPGGGFFDPNDPAPLARLMQACATSPPPPPGVDYDATRRRFAEDLWRMIGEVDRDLRRRHVDRLVIEG